MEITKTETILKNAFTWASAALFAVVLSVSAWTGVTISWGNTAYSAATQVDRPVLTQSIAYGSTGEEAHLHMHSMRYMLYWAGLRAQPSPACCVYMLKRHGY